MFDYRVRWEHYAPSSDTWQPFNSISHIWRDMDEEQRKRVPMRQQFKHTHPECPPCEGDEDAEEAVAAAADEDAQMDGRPRSKRQALRRAQLEDGPLLKPAATSAAASAVAAVATAAAVSSPHLTRARSRSNSASRSVRSGAAPMEIDVLHGHSFVSSAEPLSSDDDERNDREERSAQRQRRRQRQAPDSAGSNRSASHSPRSAAAAVTGPISQSPLRRGPGRPPKPAAPVLRIESSDDDDDDDDDNSTGAKAAIGPAAATSTPLVDVQYTHSPSQTSSQERRTWRAEAAARRSG